MGIILLQLLMHKLRADSNNGLIHFYRPKQNHINLRGNLDLAMPEGPQKDWVVYEHDPRLHYSSR